MADVTQSSTLRRRRAQPSTAPTKSEEPEPLDVPTPERAALVAAQSHSIPTTARPKLTSVGASPALSLSPESKGDTPSPSSPSSLSPSANKAGTPETGAGTAHARQSPNALFFMYASLAGLFGALSSVVGKAAVAADAVPQLVAFATDRTGLPAPGPDSALFTLLPLALRVLFFVANAIFTGQMWRYYIKSLSLGPTPVCQIINTGTNFAVSALCGILFFAEEVNTTWAVGAFLVVLGLGLVVTDPTAAGV